MDKITVVCHEDHVVSYEDYAGKCLLCVVEDLMREVGRLTAVCKEKEWVGLTGNEARKFYEKYTNREELIYAIDKFLEEKNGG